MATWYPNVTTRPPLSEAGLIKGCLTTCLSHISGYEGLISVGGDGIGGWEAP